MNFFVPFMLLGLFKLLHLCWSDLKSLKVDERHSTFMMGVVSLMFFVSGRLLELMVVLFVFSYFLSKIKEKKWLTGLGDGDVTIISWVLGGLWFFGWEYIIIFMASYLLIFTYLHYFVTKKDSLPATIPIVIGFIIVSSAQSIGVLI